VVAQNTYSTLINGRTLILLGTIIDDTHLLPYPAVGMDLVFMKLFDNGEAYTETKYNE